MTTTNIVEIKKYAKGLSGTHLFQHYFICKNCNSTVGRHDIFCRMCGKEFMGLIEHREIGP